MPRTHKRRKGCNCLSCLAPPKPALRSALKAHRERAAGYQLSGKTYYLDGFLVSGGNYIEIERGRTVHIKLLHPDFPWKEK